MQVTVHAPAKINLTLDIVGVRADGYHLLESVFQSVSIYDTIVATPAEPGVISLTVAGDSCDCPMEVNTAYKATKVFFDATGIRGGVHLTLTKRIPQQAGMGGGSADAAGVLWALDALYGTRLTTSRLHRMGEKIGADVPFCVVGGTKFVTGIGNGLTGWGDMPPCHIVVAQPKEGISTAAAYAAVDRATITRRPDHEAVKLALWQKDLRALCGQAINVFEDATELKGVKDIRRRMEAFSPLCSQMTGSGSAVFAIFEDEEAAKACLAELQKNYPKAFLCHPCDGCIIEKESFSTPCE